MSEKTILKFDWNGNTKGSGKIQTNNFLTTIAIPVAKGGSGEGTEPKSLLVSSALACYSMTLVAMLESRNLIVEKLSIETEATNSKEEGFKIFHYPSIVLSSDATEEQMHSAHRAITAADKGCAVGNMLKKADVQISIEGKVALSK